MNEIAVTLEVAPKEYKPLFCEQEDKNLLDGEAWAWGFWEGINLRAKAWEQIWHSNLATVVLPVYLLGAEELEEEEMALHEDPVQRHKLKVEVEAAISEIYHYWLPHRKSEFTTTQRETPKISHNDDCSCGNGKKYKKFYGFNKAED